MEFTSEKSIVEQYSLKGKDNTEWATITLGSNGYFSAVSSFGNYAYKWFRKGEEFKRFFVEICKEAEDRLYPDISNRSLEKIVDMESTFTPFLLALLEKRRYNEIDEREAREAYDELWDLIDSTSELNGETIYYEWNAQTHLQKIFDHEDLIYGPETRSKIKSDGIVFNRDTQCLDFCKYIAPKLVKLLEEELQLKTESDPKDDTR